jgi:hypothetical protein
MVGLFSEFSNVARQHRDPVRPAQPGDSHLQGVHSSGSTISKNECEVGAFLSNHQARHSGPCPDINHCSGDFSKGCHKSFRVFNHLWDWSVTQGAHSLSGGKNLFNGAANSHLTNVLVALQL